MTKLIVDVPVFFAGGKAFRQYLTKRGHKVTCVVTPNIVIYRDGIPDGSEAAHQEIAKIWSKWRVRHLK